MFSTLFKLNVKDFVKAAIIAALGVTWGVLTPVITAGNFPSWAELGSALLLGAKAAGVYILKNLFTNNDGEFAKTDK